LQVLYRVWAQLAILCAGLVVCGREPSCFQFVSVISDAEPLGSGLDVVEGFFALGVGEVLDLVEAGDGIADVGGGGEAAERGAEFVR
jgi:hypothetical protein